MARKKEEPKDHWNPSAVTVDSVQWLPMVLDCIERRGHSVEETASKLCIDAVERCRRDGFDAWLTSSLVSHELRAVAE